MQCLISDTWILCKRQKVHIFWVYNTAVNCVLIGPLQLMLKYLIGWVTQASEMLHGLYDSELR